jgi:hypothetical protein
MLGLNSDPTSNGSYDTIDFAWYFEANTNLLIYENGTNTTNAGTYTTSTVVSITYDGYNVRYWKDGVIQRTVARAIGVPLYFDSSFYNIGASLNSVAFGPMGESGTSGAAGSMGPPGPSGAPGSSGPPGPVNVYSVTFDASYITPPIDYTITHNLGLSGNFKNIVITVHGIVYGAARLYYGNDFTITSYSSNSFVFRLTVGNWNQTQTVSISLVRA